ncbi:unnamed protein product [Meganyctiphanes norvegica]|uniref:Uncharacterized protein n=1 Tax=Meganyctiphanes norvegica TaxID=48144 RepID=A0AAV2S644_MEGNR
MPGLEEEQCVVDNAFLNDLSGVKSCRYGMNSGLSKMVAAKERSQEEYATRTLGQRHETLQQKLRRQIMERNHEQNASLNSEHLPQMDDGVQQDAMEIVQN